jgi:outer membrane protein TolC
MALLCLLPAPAEPAVELTLLKAVEQALRSNPKVDELLARQQEAEAQREVAESALYPQIQLEAILKEGPPAAPNLFTQGLVNSILTRQAGASFVLSQTVLDSGARYHRLLAREHETRAQSHTQILERARLFLKVVKAYYQGYLAQELLTQANRDLELRRSTQQLADQKFRRGLTPRLDVSQALLQVQESEIQRLEAESQFVLACQNLAQLQGLDSSPLYQLLEPGLPEGLSDQSLPAMERPEIQALSEQMLARQELARAADGEGGASLKFLATAGYLNVGPENLVQNRYYAVGLAFTLPVFDGGAAQARTLVYQRQTEATRAALREMSLELTHQLEKARAQLEAWKAMEDLRKHQLEEARYQVRSAQLRYRHGLNSIQEVYLAQESLTRTERAALLTVHQRRVAEAELRFASGQVWPW